MLEITQEILEKVDPLLDVGDVQSAGEMLVGLDPTSLRALVIHVLRERGAAVAEAVAEIYLNGTVEGEQQAEAA